jgi:hypothetical protein
MGFWSKLGKIGLSIAPYVAAPFTGGASLAFAPAARTAVSAWNAKDAKNNAAKGLAPSKFDSILGMASDIGGMVGGAGGMSGLGKNFGSSSFTGNSTPGLSGWANTAGQIAGQAIQNRSQPQQQPQFQQNNQLPSAQMPESSVGDPAIARRRQGLGSAFARGAAQAQAY